MFDSVECYYVKDTVCHLKSLTPIEKLGIYRLVMMAHITHFENVRRLEQATTRNRERKCLPIGRDYTARDLCMMGSNCLKKRKTIIGTGAPEHRKQKKIRIPDV